MNMTMELKSWGHAGGDHGHVIVKSDAESSITAVLEEVAKRLGGKAVPEKIPKGEPQSNGAVEEAGNNSRDDQSLERKLGGEAQDQDVWAKAHSDRSDPD